MSQQRKIGVIGLGYVGLPAALAFAKKQPIVGFDTDPIRINALKKGIDSTGEVVSSLLSNSQIQFSCDKESLRACDFFIVTVPTPLDNNNKPDLSYLHKACEMIGSVLTPGAIVVIECTVYPGATQEVCIPSLEHASRLKAGHDFSVGYSPERINPADPEHGFANTPKIIAALDPETLDIMASVYEQVISAPLTRAASIKVAEAAKIIENTQRDVNIALMNEFSLAFAAMGIDTHEVIEAAKTKWNFMPFSPGLVGGHCIGVAPYYLAYKAIQQGFTPQLTLAARAVNEQMGTYVAKQTIKALIQAGSRVKGAHVGIMGLTFKENCADVRHSRVVDIIRELNTYDVHVSVHDPIADPDEVLKEYDIELSDWEDLQNLDALVLSVAHRAYQEISPEEFAEKFSQQPIIMDIKAMLDRDIFAASGIQLWRL